MFKRCCVAVSLAAVLLAFSGLAWSAGNKPSKPSGPAVHTGTLVDAGIEALNLPADDATLKKAIDALKTWAERSATSKADLDKQLADAQQQKKAETAKGKQANKAKLADLTGKIAAIDAKYPSESDNYKSARDTLTGILAADQLTKIDDTARARMVETATKTFDTTVANWTKKDGITITADEQAKIDKVKDKIKDEVGKLDLGASTRGVDNTLIAKARAALPQADQDKLGKKPNTSAPDGHKSKSGD